VVRIRAADRAALEKHVFQRYPAREWGTFFQFGWRRTPWGLAMSFIDSLLPLPGDLDRQTPLTTFRDQYSRRAFQSAASVKPRALGVVHSHPVGYPTSPSLLDDDMDRYFSKEFSARSDGAPYCSLILQRSDPGGLTFSGRVYDRGEWLPVTDLLTIGNELERHKSELLFRHPTEPQSDLESTTARLQGLMGDRSAARLQSAVLGFIGCGGTGSPGIEVAARAGVGEFILVDPQHFGRSNFERMHGASYRHLQMDDPPFKIDIMRAMIADINPHARVTGFVGNILHENVIDELLRCDALLGCSDSFHGRAAQSDLAQHFLLPSLDIGVAMDGQHGRVTEQLVDITQSSPDFACAFCGERINTTEMAYELMSETEKLARQAEAAKAAARGDDPDQYWRRSRQLHTVGYLTTAAGALGAGYLEGWLTGTFGPPHSTMQFDIGKERLACVAPPRSRRPQCTCGQFLGWAEAARSHRNVALPTHWPQRAVLRFRSEAGSK
jgi:hypothetical protein